MRQLKAALYEVVGAASIAAKVTRDACIAHWTYLESQSQAKGDRSFGSGYPGDVRTVVWLENNLHPVFGLPNMARFSWSTVKTLFDKRAHKVQWYVKAAADHCILRSLPFGPQGRGARFDTEILPGFQIASQACFVEGDVTGTCQRVLTVEHSCHQFSLSKCPLQQVIISISSKAKGSRPVSQRPTSKSARSGFRKVRLQTMKALLYWRQNECFTAFAKVYAISAQFSYDESRCDLFKRISTQVHRSRYIVMSRRPKEYRHSLDQSLSSIIIRLFVTVSDCGASSISIACPDLSFLFSLAMRSARQRAALAPMDEAKFYRTNQLLPSRLGHQLACDHRLVCLKWHLRPLHRHRHHHLLRPLRLRTQR